MECKALPEMKETLGELIRRRMRDVGIKNNSELARLIERSDAYVGDLINNTAKTKSGTYKPRQKTIAALSKVLRVSESEILESIGYVSTHRGSEFDDEIRAALRGSDKWDDAEKERVLQAVKTFVAGIKAERAANNDA